MGFQDGLNMQTINIGPDEQPVTINKLAGVIADVVGFDGRQPIHVLDRPPRGKNRTVLRLIRPADFWDMRRKRLFGRALA